MKRLPLLSILVLAIGCAAGSARLSTASSRQGIFLITSQAAKQPTVVVNNDSDTPLRLLLNSAEGRLIALDVPARSSGSMDVPTGHYEAKVIAQKGQVASAYGEADITEYKRYTTGFVVGSGGPHHFHIGG